MTQIQRVRIDPGAPSLRRFAATVGQWLALRSRVRRSKLVNELLRNFCLTYAFYFIYFIFALKTLHFCFLIE